MHLVIERTRRLETNLQARRQVTAAALSLRNWSKQVV